MKHEREYYFCDPQKNTKCRKKSCGYRVSIRTRSICFRTTDQRKARIKNGKPMIYDESKAIWHFCTRKQIVLHVDSMMESQSGLTIIVTRRDDHAALHQKDGKDG